MDKRAKKKQNSKPHNYIENIYVDIDYDALAKAIVNAQNQADDERTRKNEIQKEEQLKEWHKIVYYKECPNNSGKIKTFLYNIRNAVCGLYALIIFKRENAKNDHTTFSLLQFATLGLFDAIRFLLYIITAFAILAAIRNNELTWLIWGIGSFIFARFFRIASFEIINMKDRQYLISIFSAITSFLALIIALLALLRGVLYNT